jgi:cell fate (sporulation/competence/biofilm development) regulator YmcA (YheA/YmcA/DUF963 family)
MTTDLPPTNALAERVDHTDTIDDLHWANLEIEKSQRQISRGMSELAEGIVTLALILLDVRRRRLYRFDPAYPTFERFVEQRHGISAQQANLYVDALTALGPQQYRTLISDLGVQRTFALALLQQADPALVTALQRLPAAERHAVTVAEIEAVDAAVADDLRSRVAQLEQEITREQGLLQQTRRRLQEVEDLHQRVTGGLIEERDSARQALDQEQIQTERLRKLLREARETPAAPARTAGSAPTAPAAPPPPAAPAVPATNVTEAVVVVVTCDVEAIINDARGLTTNLERVRQLRREDIAPDQRQRLSSALQALSGMLQTLLRHP